MYMIRPQYFITFLSIISALGLKYKDVLIESNKEAEQFKDINLILEEFEHMKSMILDKPIKKLETEIQSINKNANTILNLSNSIINSTNDMTNTMIENIKDKLEAFNIKKITNKIKKLDI